MRSADANWSTNPTEGNTIVNTYTEVSEELEQAAQRLREVYSDLTHTLTKLTEAKDDGTYTEPLGQAMRDLNTVANVIGDIGR